MSNTEFQYKLAALFKTLRDGHVSYEIPGNHRCVKLLKAVAFTIVNEGIDEKIVVHSRSSHSEVADMTNNSQDIQAGDELISIDGISARTYLQNLKYQSGGSNEFGALRKSLVYLSFIDGKNNPLPTQDSNRYVFKSQIQRKLYRIDLPWIALVDFLCWEQADILAYSIKYDKVPIVHNLNPRSFFSKHKVVQTNTPNESMEPSLAGNTEVSDYTVHSSSDPIIRWAIFKPASKNMGIIFIESFWPQESDIDKAVGIIKNLLLDQLKDTNSIIFDVRKNAGGLVGLADKIPQLFGTNIMTASGRAVVHNLVKKVIFHSKTIGSDHLFKDIAKNATFTSLLKFTQPDDANRIGQVYTRPVGVFTSGACYSSCEIFAASFEDNSIGTIFGEDGLTGGGGASALNYNYLLDQLDTKNLPALPFRDTFPSIAQNFQISWMQVVRLDGNIIEDLGVASDYIIRPNITDIQMNTWSVGQYDRISDILKTKAGSYFSKFKVYPENESEVVIGTHTKFLVETRGYKTLLLIGESNELLVKKRIFLTTTLTKTSFQYLCKTVYASLVRYNIQGLDTKGKVVFSTWRVVKYVPKLVNYLAYRPNTDIDLHTDSVHCGLFEKDSRMHNMGWTNFLGQLEIGSGRGYKAMTESTISYFLNIPKTGIEITIRAELDTGFGDAFTFVGYIINGTTINMFKSKSKHSAISNIYHLPSGNVELFVRFVSTKSGTGFGAKIRSITME